MSNPREEWLAADDGAELYTLAWEPSNSDRAAVATVVFFHGLGEHANRYHHVFAEFARNGISVRALDQRGHGRTAKKAGIIGHLEGFDRALADGKIVSDAVRKPGVPHFAVL